MAQNGTEGGTETAQARGRKPEARRTCELGESLPAGITLGVWRDGRNKPFFVRYGADRRVESFAAERDRNDRAEKLAEARTKEGIAALDIDMTEWRRYQDFRKRCPAPLHEIEALWAKHGHKTFPTVTRAVDTFLALRKTERGEHAVGGHMKLHLERLKANTGATAMNEIAANLLRDLLHTLKNPRDGKPMSLVTKHDHLKNWNVFFERAVLEGWCDKNPCSLVILPPIDAVDKVVLPPRKIFDLLKANRDEPVIGRIVFELFGGLRASSAARLKPEHVKRSVKGVRLPGTVINEETQQTKVNHKSRKTIFRQGHPEALWAWFDHCQPGMWEVRAGSYDERKREAFIRAGVENPGNILRDSCASYLFAATNNLPLVSSIMQHTTTKTTLIYVGVAEKDHADLVMAMTPKAVRLPWETFLKKHR